MDASRMRLHQWGVAVRGDGREEAAMLTKEELPPCPVATCFQLFGNKWKIYIIQQLQEAPVGFNALQRAIPGISQKVLSSNLKEMEAAGLITRTVIPETPIRTEYALSRKAMNK